MLYVARIRGFAPRSCTKARLRHAGNTHLYSLVESHGREAGVFRRLEMDIS
jgi:hypothetical protein